MDGGARDHRGGGFSGAPSTGAGAISGLAVTFAFTVLHGVLIADIWFNIGPMLFAGALCGVAVAWSYRKSVPVHATSAWFRFAGIHVVEMVVLGALSLLLLRPQFTMAQLIVADDAFDRLLTPSMPLIVGAMVVGTIVVWVGHGRRRGALLPILTTQVLLVFLLGHQFAFLGLVRSSAALLAVFAEFSLLTAGLAAAYCVGVLWSERALDRLRTGPPDEAPGTTTE